MAIQIQHLNKYIGKQHVLKDICLTINDGEVIGLLGPNGAGKSTLMKIMVGVWDATNGELQVPESIGFLPEQNPLYEDMYVREYLRFFAELRKQSCTTLHNITPYCTTQLVEDLINRVGLQREAHKKIGQLSKGYRQRVGLAQAMIGNPQLLILDEPTTGLDPNQLEEIRTLIRNIGNPVSETRNPIPDPRKIVILSTHILQEVKQMCSRVIIIDRGEIKVDKPISEIEDLEQTFREATIRERSEPFSWNH